MKRILFIIIAISYHTHGQFVVPYTGSLTITGCTGTLTDHAGNNNYDNNANGSITILPNVENENICVEFKSFKTESCCDILKIYSGTSTENENQIGAFKGNSNPGNVVSTFGKPITLKFTSDNSTVGAGFEAILHCNTFDIDTKTITSDFNFYTKNIKLNTFENWKIASTIPGWLYFSATAGSYFESNISASIYPNFTFQPREAIITFLGINSKTSRVLYVSQAAAQFYVTDTIGVKAEKNIQNIDILSNQFWQIINNYPNDITLSASSGEKSGVVGLQIASNPSDRSKTFILEVIESITSLTSKVVIIQEPTLAGSNININAISNKGQKTLSTCSGFVYDNGGLDYDYNNNCNAELVLLPNEIGKYIYIKNIIIDTEPNVDFLKIANGSVYQQSNIIGNFSGSNTTTSPLISSASDGSLVLKFITNSNTTTKGFVAEIGCTTTVGTNPNQFMYLSENKKILSSSSATFPISILGFEGNFSVLGLPTWLSTNIKTGNINQKINLTLSQNTASFARMAIVTITNGSLANTLEITQMSAKNSNILLFPNPSTLILSTFAGISTITSNFSISTNVPFQLIAPEWVSLNKYYAYGTETLVSIEAKPIFEATTVPRFGKIMIVAIDTIIAFDVFQSALNTINGTNFLSVSKSYISIPSNAQQVQIAISATGAWFITDFLNPFSEITLSANAGFGSQNITINFPKNDGFDVKKGGFTVVSQTRELGILYNQYPMATSIFESENTNHLFSKGIFIYPNPNAGTIHLKSLHWITKLELYTIYGALVKSFQIDNSYAVVSDIDVPDGTYFIKAFGKNNTSFFQKLIFQK